MAWHTFRAEPARGGAGARDLRARRLLQTTIYTELAVDHHGLLSLLGAVVAGTSSLGLTFYSGMLERLVGSVERGERPQPILEVLATLPWLRLLLADAVLVVVGAAASVLVVLPGLVVGTLFALVGPLINLLDSSVPEAFRKSVQVVWPHFFLVLCFISLPLVLEHEIVVLVAELVPHEKVGLLPHHLCAR